VPPILSITPAESHGAVVLSCGARSGTRRRSGRLSRCSGRGGGLWGSDEATRGRGESLTGCPVVS